MEPALSSSGLGTLVSKDLYLNNKALGQLLKVGLSPHGRYNNVQRKVGPTNVRINPCVLA